MSCCRQDHASQPLSVHQSAFERFLEPVKGRGKSEPVTNTLRMFISMALHCSWADVEEKADMLATIMGSTGNYLAKVRSCLDIAVIYIRPHGTRNTLHLLRQPTFLLLLEEMIKGAFATEVIRGQLPSKQVREKIGFEMVVICDRDEDGQISLVEVREPNAYLFSRVPLTCLDGGSACAVAEASRVRRDPCPESAPSFQAQVRGPRCAATVHCLNHRVAVWCVHQDERLLDDAEVRRHPSLRPDGPMLAAPNRRSPTAIRGPIMCGWPLHSRKQPRLPATT